ncbi:MAG: prolyl oligopeptidase family serine peptidase [Desulfurococcaceae archaeon]
MERDFSPKGFINSMDSDGKRCVFKYESFTTPYRIYVLHGKGLRCIKSVELNDKYIVEESWVKSSDGMPTHFFRVRNRDKDMGVVLAYGYGGYRTPMVPIYTPFIMPLLDDGGEYVVANIRGDSEYGEKWYREGMRDKKQNVFNDFIAILEYLEEKRTNESLYMELAMEGY